MQYQAQCLMDVVEESKLSKTYLFAAIKKYFKNLSIQNIFTVFLFSQPTNARIGQTCTDPRGKQGTCNFIFEPQCTNVLRALKLLGPTSEVLRFLQDAIRTPCGFEQFDYLLCCAPK